MRTFLKHKLDVDVCIELLGPVRFYGEVAKFKGLYWNLGQTGVSFPMSIQTNFELKDGLENYKLITTASLNLREEFERKFDE